MEENQSNDKNPKALLRSQSALPYAKKPINQILEKIDSHVFMGRVRAYDAFKFFDKDKDGKHFLFKFLIYSVNSSLENRLYYKGRFAQKISRVEYFK